MLLIIILSLLLLIIIIQQLQNKAIWGQKKKYSIGLYEGESIFDLQPIKNNPILTKFDVTDVIASFVADPFWIKKDKYYLFMEVKSKRKRDIGEIGLVVGDTPYNFKYQKIIIKENFHLSYPYLFEYQNEFFMFLESGENRDLRLYKAVNFPDEWQLHKTFLEGKRLADPTLLYLDRFYLFVTNMDKKSLEIYISDDLETLTFHSSHYQNDPSKNRNGGRIFVDNGKIYRFVQNCKNYYGEKVDMYEITKLDKTSFEEKFIKTILSPSKKGWNSDQMHNIDIIKENNRYYAIVDGGSKEKENFYIINKFLRKFL